MGSKLSAIVGEKIEHETGMRLTDMVINEKMAICFQRYEEITIEEGRKLLIKCVDLYLKVINSNTVIRPYLAHYSFAPKDVGVIIVILTPTHDDVPVGNISAISAINGQLNYRVRQADSTNHKLILQEPYEEAIKITKSYR